MAKQAIAASALAIGLIANAGVASAQAAEQPGPGPAAGAGQEEVVVTAQRRDTKLAKTPVSVAVVSAQALAKQNITTEADLQSATPGLTIRTGANSNEINFAIRGQSVDQFSGTRPGVLPYFNDVPISSNGGGGGSTTSFYDLQSVQVLKGPQGTLFGRNATGGAVLFTTAKPTETLEGYVSARVGDYDTRQLEGAVNLPVYKDQVLLRLAGFYGDQDGFQRNLFDGSRPGSLERYGVRGSLTVQDSNIRNELVLDYYHADGSNIESVLYALDPTIGFVPATFLYSPNADLALGPGAWAAYLAAHPNPQIPAGGLSAYLPIQQARGPFRIADNDLNFYRAENFIATNATTIDLGDDTQLKNILGYATLDTDVAGDSDGSPFGIAGAGEDPNRGRPGGFTRARIFSDELQLLGKTAGGRLDYVAGLYYADEKSYTHRQSTFFDLFGGPLTTNEFRFNNRTYAAFAQGTYDLDGSDGSNGFSVTGGLRYTSERVRETVLPDDVAYPTPAQLASGSFANPQSKTIDNVSWTAGAQYQFEDGLLLYAKTRRSFRNGGYNGNQAPRVGGSAVSGNSYDTETATDIEAGAKFQGNLGTVRTRLNLAVYKMWIDDSQRNAFAFIAGNPSSLTVNVPKTEIYGFEFDSQVQVTDNITLGGTLNYTHAEFTDGLTNVNGTPVEFTTVPDTPEWSGTLFAEVDVPLTQNLTGSLRADMYSQRGTFFTSTGGANPTAHLPGYTTADFRLGIEDEDAGWELSANLKNAFDETYYVGGIALGQLLQYNVALPGAPRTYSVELRYRF